MLGPPRGALVSFPSLLTDCFVFRSVEDLRSNVDDQQYLLSEVDQDDENGLGYAPSGLCCLTNLRTQTHLRPSGVHRKAVVVDVRSAGLVSWFDPSRKRPVLMIRYGFLVFGCLPSWYTTCSLWKGFEQNNASMIRETQSSDPLGPNRNPPGMSNLLRLLRWAVVVSRADSAVTQTVRLWARWTGSFDLD